MQTRNKIFDDIGQLMTNAMGVAQGAKDEAETAMKSLLDRWMADRDFVTREEFDAVRAMAQKAREENDKLVRYGFISTGNFNESTAKIYTDFTLLTSNSKILKEINKVFDFFEVNYKINRYKHIITSPHYTKTKLFALIDTEIENAKNGKTAYIKLKMNSISSYDMVDKLYEASRAGVKIQMIVRGLCCLVPGINGMSENIEVISIIDKFLEHTRLYIFANNNNPKIYISSADWMTRNIDNRVEVSCPIYDEDIKKELQDLYEICWNDNVKARIINETQDNTYRRNDKPKVRAQFDTYKYYLNKLEG